MFSHVMLGANDIQKSKKFYDPSIGHPPRPNSDCRW